MYTLYRETDPSTSISLSVNANFIPSNNDDKQLITIGGSYLRIFRLNPYVLIRQSPINAGWKQTTKLETILTTSLFLPVKSIAIARTSLASNDCLLLAFDEAKLSIVAFDETNNDIKTVALYSYEEELLRGGFTHDLVSPIIRADPDNRCAAMLVYGRHLAILPLQLQNINHDILDDDINMSKTIVSTSYTVVLDSIDPRLQNVVDMCFLYGYYEPTLLFLYEPMQTTAGRASIRQDTYCILGLSINVKDRVQAIVWQVAHLPLDAFRLLPIPKPIGGAVVFGTNEIIYLNQSVPPCGIATNSCLDGFTQFPLKNQRDQRVALDGSAVNLITPSTMVLVARDGRLFVVSLVVDNTNVVKSIHMQREFDTAIPCTVTLCSSDYVFIGSQLDNSQLLHLTQIGDVTVDMLQEAPSAKRPRLLDGVPVDAAMANADDALDDLALYGEVLTDVAYTESAQVAQYRFQIVDELLNIGPSRTLCAGCPSSLSSVFLQADHMDPIFDLVSASGYGKSGSIVVLQRTIRPNILTSSSIHGALQIWTVGQREDNAHQFLLVSKEVMTMVLELENEIAELDSSGFIMDQRTVAAGDLGDGSLIVQIAPMSVVLLRGRMRLQELELDISFPVASASICDPFICLLTENGHLLFLRLDNGRLVLSRPPIQQIPATAISLYRDFSGLFVHGVDNIGSKNSTTKHNHDDDRHQSKSSVDMNDDDLLLYGNANDTANSTKINAVVTVNGISTASSSSFGRSVQDPNTVMPTYWLVVTRENGHLQIYSIPEFQLVYVVRKFSHAFDVLYDSGIGGDTIDEMKLAVDDQQQSVRELMLHGMGMNQSRPLLVALINSQVTIYEAFPYDAGYRDHLAIRFKKLKKTVVARSERSATSSSSSKTRTNNNTTTGTNATELDRYPSILHAFERVGDECGIFVAGPYPSWLLLRGGELRLHPMIVDGPIRSFTPFNNANCPNGFLYLTCRDETMMRICSLSTEFELDASCPTKKILLGKTVHFIIYMLQSNTYAVVTSDRKDNNRLCALVSDEKTFETHEKDANFIYPSIDSYKLQLYSPANWAPIPLVGDIDFEEFEIVTAIKEVLLKSEGTVSGYQNYMAVGTTYNYGEEVQVRGRIMINEIIDVVPEPGQPMSRHRIKTIYDKEQKGPISSMCSCQGYLLTGMGQKVYIWLFKDNDLQGISFLDMHFYVHQLIGMRNLALAADLYRSVALLRYQEDCKALSLASRDLRPIPQQAVPMGVEFIVDNSQLAFLMSDESGIISVFTYQPEAKESLGGQRLVLRADMHIGTRVTQFVRVRGHVGNGMVENRATAANRQTCLFVSLDGTIGAILPLSEKVYRRLHMLQQCMGTQMAHTAGLNPRAARQSRGARNQSFSLSSHQSSRNMVDGDLVWLYLHLSNTERLDIAKRLGTARQQLTDDIIELQRLFTHF